MSEAQGTSCKTFATPDGSCSSAALTALESELKRRGLTETNQAPDLVRVSLKCSSSIVIHDVGDGAPVGQKVRERVYSMSLAITTHHGVMHEQAWTGSESKGLDEFLLANGYTVKIVPKPGPPYSILEPKEDKTESLDTARTIGCLPRNVTPTRIASNSRKGRVMRSWLAPRQARRVT